MGHPILALNHPLMMWVTPLQNQLWFLFKLRINLSPFTKDFRGEEQL